MDVSSVTSMRRMFENATQFNSDISDWDVGLVDDMYSIFSDSGLSVANYSNLLIKWSQLPVLQLNVSLGAIGIFHNSSATSAKEFLANDKGWSVVDSGLAPDMK